MNDDKTNYSIAYDDFDHKGITEYFDYRIPFDKFIEGVRIYFDNQMITLDGKDNDIWNAFVNLGVLDDIFDYMEDWFKDECRNDAYEEYKEYIEWYYEDELNQEEEE